ncbi:MAG TPA: peptidylprolyl isomerase [Thermoanaerobaculia bacterium]|nr:peptidylprolyl isomerase [Thermoanaerobaculia bacterium]
MGRRSIALLAVLLLAGACRREPPPAPDVVAKIGGQEVRYARFESYMAGAVGDPDTVLASDVLTALFDQFLDEQLLARLAADRGLASAARLARQPRQLVSALLAQEPGEPTAVEVAAHYAAHRQQFARPERVRLRQILVADRKAAERAAREIAAGTGFEEVARRESRDASAGTGGYQGELSRADLPPGFADTIFALRPGEVSRVVPADYGFHIFQVIERLPAQVAPLSEVEGEIRAKLRQERADRRLAALVRECRTRYTVLVFRRNLPFNYEGFYSDSKAHQPP